ncbi:hypothetical protein GDO78_019331 [Eleutherodactylus coqui]|uniref:Uncharacterized protein n=1 Tax=Eleutherodactylus coqui TaxID=57060 RepID=A0A8J6EAS4_ELECQ|nr:hypothetical protein GDO78_019331 [Eleutherodactylus coqui]
MVILCGYDTIKDALVNHAEFFSDRPHNPLFSKSIKEHGIAFSNGENWKVMRRFTLSTLRHYGMGKKTIENRIVKEAECLSFSNFTSLNAALTNIIVGILLNERFEYEDPTILRLKALASEKIKLLGSPWVKLYNSFPSVMDRLPGPHRTICKNFKEFQSIIIATFTKSKKEFDMNDQSNLGKQESTQYYHNENLIVLVGDLFAAAVESMSSTMRWGLLLMTKYPEIQKKVQSEIDKVIGSAQPQMEHRKQMAYTDAVIHEIQRFGDVTSITIPHGTTIIPVLHSIHKDKKYFEKPEEFYPEHFLDSDGNFKKNEAFIPYSLGNIHN